jgi:hypothetical protein
VVEPDAPASLEDLDVEDAASRDAERTWTRDGGHLISLTIAIIRFIMRAHGRYLRKPHSTATGTSPVAVPVAGPVGTVRVLG